MRKSFGSDRKDRNDRNDKKDKKDRFFWKKRACRYCSNKDLKVDYKDGKALSPYINERGKVLPRRITSCCAYHQRQVTTAIKRARILALLPFTSAQVKWR